MYVKELKLKLFQKKILDHDFKKFGKQRPLKRDTFHPDSGSAGVAVPKKILYSWLQFVFKLLS